MNYLKLWLAFFKNCFQRELEFKAQFFGKITVELFFLFSQVLTFVAFFSASPKLGSWTFSEIQLFLGSLFVIDGFFMLLTHDNMNKFNSYIKLGELDFHLLRPVNSLFMSLFRFCNFVGFINLAFGIALLYLSGKISFSTNTLLLFYHYIIGFLIVFSLNIIVCSVTFWTQQATSLVWLFAEFYQFSFRPDELYPSIVRKIILFVFPAAFIVSVPVKLYLGKIDGTLWHSLPTVVALVFLAASIGIWKLSLKKYEGVMA